MYWESRSYFVKSVLFALTVCCVSANAVDTIDPSTGLIVADNWELARTNCGACHSYRLVTAQRGDRVYWLKTIRWMQKTQNLWQLPAIIEDPLLDYLASNYDESEWGRRPALPPTLLPE